MLTKKQRNSLLKKLAKAGLDPTQCDLDDREHGVWIEHRPTRSVMVANEFSSGRELLLVGKYGDGGQEQQIIDNDWPRVERRFYNWAKAVKELVDTPDLWVALRREKDAFSSTEYRTMSNAPFTADERLRIAEQLREIKVHIIEQYELSGERLSRIEGDLDEVVEASHRLGRKDWLNIFYGVMFTLIVTALLPPDTVQHMIVTVIHGLGDLFGFGAPPPSLPPVA
jgi:hypothetical protein